MTTEMKQPHYIIHATLWTTMINCTYLPGLVPRDYNRTTQPPLIFKSLVFTQNVLHSKDC